MSGATNHTGLRALEPERERVFLAAIGEGVPFAAAARLAGIGERTVKLWLEIAAGKRSTWFDGSEVSAAARTEAERFGYAVAAARDRFEQEMVGSIRHAATTVNPKTGTYDWRAGLALLTHHPQYRGDWHEHREIEVHHTGEVSHAMQLASQLSDDELMAAYNALELPSAL